MSNADVKFIRKNGRIIPIRLTKSQKGQIQGATSIGAGVAIAAAGGQLYKRAVTKSAALSFKGFSALESIYKARIPSQLNIFNMAKHQREAQNIAKIKSAALSSLNAGKKLGSISKSIRIGATATGAALIGYGTSKFINSMTKKQKEKLNPNLISAGAAALGAVVPNAWEASKKSFTAGMANRQTAMKFGATKWVEYSPRIREAILSLAKSKL